MIRILYFSTADADMKRDDVNDIVAQAQVRNAEKGVTGVLVYNDRNFCQVLEGDEKTVRDLVATIGADPRHHGFKILDEKPIETRHFAEWSLRLVDGLDFGVVINAMKD